MNIGGSMPSSKNAIKLSAVNIETPAILREAAELLISP